MFETLFDFLSKMVEVYNDEKTSLEDKIKLTCEKYIDMTIAEPLLPTFVLNELKNNPTSFLKMPSTKMIMKSRLVAQYQEGVKKRNICQNRTNPFCDKYYELDSISFHV